MKPALDSRGTLDIVVGAEIESEQPILVAAALSEEDDGYVAALADNAAGLELRGRGQMGSEDDQVKRLAIEENGGIRGSDAHDDIAGLRNRIGTFTRDGRHIIDKHQVMRYLNLPLN